MQTKSITDVYRGGETDDTRQKKNEQGRCVATKEQPASADSMQRHFLDEKKYRLTSIATSTGETDRLGEYADSTDDLPRSGCGGGKRQVDGPDVVWGLDPSEA
jgi:hypothetical protein